MKRILIVLFFVLFFIGCQQVTNELPQTTDGSTAIQTTDGVRYVKNSEWNAFSLSYLTAKTASRAAEAEISADDLESIVVTLNETEDDTQYFVEEEDVPIAESPDVVIFIVNEGDYFEFARYKIPRVEFEEKRWLYVLDASGYGGLLFIDKVPPVPVIIPDPRTRHEKYSIYMVNKYEKIVIYQGCKYEKHIDEIWDPLSDEIKAGYENNIDKLMDWYIFAFNSESVCQTYEDAPWRVVSGQIYTEPTE